ncbi:FG-GAP repeat domain-containing protein [Spirosoma rhododendri]|uniref:VCBS repeat-containing protein n=1 Tax=Spirosoma rhododendri TaxID=2728024 RepID=A0A7L5DMY5_9BACT|nr:VCBS repeat-containing protein [Spirosoma rhododendri]QJD77818.1 VCBS repeat-containing protein [Spirosoma rhododendri]
MADFNGDNKPDIVANGGSFDATKISMLLGDGKGSFAPATLIEVGNTSAFVGTADFNVDGKADLVIGLYTENKVGILLGDGTGQFSAVAKFSTGAYPNAIAIGDYNNDGKVDLVTANFNSSSTSLLLGDGKGGFGLNSDFPVGLNPLSITQGDLNGDGNLDVITANVNGSSSSSGSILLGNGQGGFSPKIDIAIGSGPSTLTLVDLNKDSNLDLAVSNVNQVAVFLGDGKAGFSAKQNIFTGNFPQSIRTSDFNKDGNADLVVVNYNSANLSVLLGDGRGNLGTPVNFVLGPNPVSTYPFFVTIGDFNLDTKPDLATIVVEKQNKITVLLNCTSINTAFSLLAPTYNCQSGAFHFNTSGGDGTPIEYYAVPGITGWTTNPDQFVDRETRTATDAQPILLRARQSGKEVSLLWDIRAQCPLGNTTSLRLVAPSYSCSSGAFTFQTTGGDGSAIEFMAIGITGWTTNPNQFVDRETRTAADAPIITLRARQNGLEVSYEWNIRYVCPIGSFRIGTVAESAAGLQVRVLGNPIKEANAELEIEGAEGQPLLIQAFSESGRLINGYQLERASATQHQRIEVGKSSESVLLLRVTTPTQSKTVKVIKQ